MIVIFHPGDLGLLELGVLIVVFLLITAVPISIIVFVILKIANRHSNKDEDRPLGS